MRDIYRWLTPEERHALALAPLPVVKVVGGKSWSGAPRVASSGLAQYVSLVPGDGISREARVVRLRVKQQ